MTNDWRFCHVIKIEGFFFPFSILCHTAECPVSSFNEVEVFVFNPSYSFFKVPTLTPVPEVLPYSVRYVLKGFFAYYSLVVVSKTSENGIELLNYGFLLH